MTTKIEDISTTERSEMKCPECGTKGLQPRTPHAHRFTSEKEKIINATACSNEDCKYHPSNESGDAVIPSEYIREQYSGGKLRSLSVPIQNISARTVGTVLSLALAIIILVGIPFGGGGGGTGIAEADPGPSVNNTSPLLTDVNGSDPWTIYEAGEGGSYYVATERNGSLLYLAPDGTETPTPHAFGTREGALDAILLWQEKNPNWDNGTGTDGNDSDLNGTDPTDYNDDPFANTPLGIYEYNGSFVIATERVTDSGTEIVFLNTSLQLSDDPYFYDSREEATEYLMWYFSEYPMNEGPNGGALQPTSPDEIEEHFDEIGIGDGPDQTTEQPSTSTPDSGTDDTDSSISIPDSGSDSDGSDSGSDSDGSDSGSDSDGSDSGSDSDFSGGDEPTVPGGDNGDTTVPDYIESGGATIQGEVVSDTGNPAGSTVHLRSTPRSTTVAEDGTYAFENISSGTHELWVDPANESKPVTAPLTLSVMENGSVAVEDSNADALYVETSSGTVQGNSITLVTQQPREILVHGNGSNLAANISFKNPANAEDLGANFTSVAIQGTATQEMTGSDVSKTFEIKGNSPPKNGRIYLTGQPVKSTVSENGVITEETTLTSEGNALPENAELVLEGTTETNKRTESGTVEDGSRSITLANSGNTDTPITFKVDGREWQIDESETGTVQNGDRSVTINNDGTAETPVSFEITGQEWQVDETETGTIQNGGGSIPLTNDGTANTPITFQVEGREWQDQQTDTGTLTASPTSIEVGGSEQPQGHNGDSPTLTLTGHSQWTDSLGSATDIEDDMEYKVIEHAEVWNSTTYDEEWIGVREHLPSGKVAYTPTEPGTYKIEYDLEAIDSFDEYHVVGGEGPSYARADIYFGSLHGGEIGEKDDVISEKTLSEKRVVGIRAGGYCHWECYNETNAEGEVTVEVTSEDIDEGKSFRAVSLGSNNDDWWAQGTAEIESVKRLDKTGAVTVMADGEQVRTTSPLGDGDTATVSVDELSVGTTQLSATTSGSLAPDYTLQWEETHKTRDVAITDGPRSLDSIEGPFSGTRELTVPASSFAPGEKTLNIDIGKGQTVDYTASWDETHKTEGVTLSDGSTTYGTIDEPFSNTREISVPADSFAPGESTFEIDIDKGETADYTVRWQETHKTEDVALSDGSTTHGTIDGPFSGTREITVPASAFTPGGNTFELTVGKGETLDYTVDWTETTITEDPSISHNGVQLCGEETQLQGEISCELRPSELGDGGVTVDTARGTVDYTLSYTEVNRPEQVTVTLNGETYSYPDDFPTSGPISDTVSLPLTDLQLGSNTVQVQTEPVNGEQTQVNATLGYDSLVQSGGDVELSVTNSDGETNSMMMDKSQVNEAMKSGNSLSLPESWFSAGQNRVHIKTVNGAPIEVTVSGDGLIKQTVAAESPS